MPLGIPKINIGISTKRSTFDKTHDYNGTLDFGFCCPTLFDEVIPKSKISLQTLSKVYLGVLPQPTFSRIKMYSFNKFIPIEDVFLAYDYMIAQQTVTSAYNRYVPKTADKLTLRQLFVLSIIGGWLYMQNHKVGGKANLELSQAIGTIWYQSADGLKDYRLTPNPTTPLGREIETLLDYFCNTMTTQYFHSSRDYTIFSHWRGLFDTGYDLIHDQDSVWHNFYITKSYLQPSFNNSDFKFYLGKGAETGIDVYVTLNLTHRGKRLWKIFQCMQYNFRYLDEEVSILPLLAYYKGWFDKYQPNRHVQWKATPAFHCIHAFYDTNRTVGNELKQAFDYMDHSESFNSVLQSLPDCCVSLPVDNFTVCTQSPVEGNTTAVSFNQYIDDLDSEGINVTSNAYPNANDFFGGSNNSIVIKWLDKLRPFVNKNSVIGARVDEYLRIHTGKGLDPNYTFGENEVDIYVHDLMSQSDTVNGDGGAYLGERAGQGQSEDTGKKTHFTAPSEGFVIQFTAIVPYGGYSQGLNPHLKRLTQFDFYTHELDSLGMAPVPNHEVFAERSYFNVADFEDDQVSDSFGFRPRFWDMKYKTNVRAGGFANKGEMNQFMGYNLDRMFTTQDCLEGVNDKPIFKVDDTMVVVNDALRFIGQSEDFGNYDRIFLDMYGKTDNFILQMIHVYKVTANMLPIADSFDTFDNEGGMDDTKTVSVSHS